MFELPTHLSTIPLDIANVRAIILIKQDDDHPVWGINSDQSEDPAESTLSSDIEQEDLDNRQEVLHLDQARHAKTLQTATVPLPTTWGRTNNITAHTPLPNIRHPAGAIAPPLLKHQKSTINKSRKSVVVKALPLPKAGGDQSVPQRKASGDPHVPQHQTATIEVAKRLMEEIFFTKTPWPIISDEKYSMVDDACKLGIDAQHCQWAFTGVPVGAPSVCQLPGGPSFKIDPYTREPVSVYSIFCSSIGLIRILNPNIMNS